MSVVSGSINLIDIGAVGGLQPPWSSRPEIVGHVLCFEPNEPAERCERLIKLDTAVWDHDGEMPFHVYGLRGTGSSLLEQNPEWVQANFHRLKGRGYRFLNETWFDRSTLLREFPVQVSRLDALLSRLRNGNVGAPDRYHFLKTDTQSGEYFVFRGAEKYLREECVGVEAELFNAPLYKGMVLEDDVIEYLRERGFEAVGATTPKGSFLSQRDWLFVRAVPRDAVEAAMKALILDLYGIDGRGMPIKRPTFGERARWTIRELLYRAGFFR